MLFKVHFFQKLPKCNVSLIRIVRKRSHFYWLSGRVNKILTYSAINSGNIFIQKFYTPVIVYLCVNARQIFFSSNQSGMNLSRSTAASQISVSAAAIWRKKIINFSVWLKERKSNDLQVLSKIIDVLFNKRKWQCVQWLLIVSLFVWSLNTYDKQYGFIRNVIDFEKWRHFRTADQSEK